MIFTIALLCFAIKAEAQVSVYDASTRGDALVILEGTDEPLITTCEIEECDWTKNKALSLVLLVVAHIVGYFMVVNYCLVNTEDRNAVTCARAFFTSVLVGLIVAMSIYFGT